MNALNCDLGVIQEASPKPLVPNSPRLRVLHIINGQYYAGAERVQDLLAQHLPASGCDVGFACVKADEYPQQRQCREVPLARTPLSHPWNVREVDQIVRIFQADQYDIVHSHTPRSAWAASRVAKTIGCPFVHTMHDVSLGQPSNLVRTALNRYTISRLRQADFVTTVSSATQDLADKLQIGKQRRTILNGVAAASPGFKRSGPCESNVDGSWNLGTVALIRPCKGIEVLIRAVATLRDRGCQAKATIVGTFYTPPYEREVRQLAQRLGVSQLIDFAGFSDNVPAHLRGFDLFVMPSIGPEGLPMVMLEAMAHSLPTIGSSVPGIADVIKPGIDGMLFPAGDDRALADLVEGFIAEDLHWLPMSQSARDRHANEFSVQRMASEYAQVYRELT